MKILIIGATRGIGEKLLELALAEGHQVTALVRDPGKVRENNPNLQVVKGDILEPAGVSNAVAGQDAVCVCIGIPPTRKPVEVFSNGIQNVLAVIGDNPARKLIAITGIGAGDSRGHGGFLYDRLINPLLLKQIYKDKDRQEALVKKSACNWMIVRPGFLTNGARTGKYRVIDDLTGVRAGKISRADVADFILRQLQSPSHFGKTPLLMY